ncbi:folate family ECF transporter S component [Vagococcus fessus]|nr:folate family ECF transporter S component [Vagococcus fessus]
MSKRKVSTQGIALMGILMALQLILTRFLAIETPFVRISFLFIPTVIMAMIFGPVLTGAGSTLADFIGIVLFPKTAPYFPGFSVSTFVTGWIYGVFFYKKKMSLKKIMLASFLIELIVDIGMNTLWLYIMMGKPALVNIPVRITKSLILFPIKTAVIYWLSHHSGLDKQIKKFRS